MVYLLFMCPNIKYIYFGIYICIISIIHRDVSFTKIMYSISTAGKLSWLKISAESI
jgi:hypothetical protein